MKKKYKKDFLKSVIVRLDFDGELPINETKPPKSIYEQLKSRFPINEESKIIGKELFVSSKITTQKDFESKVWSYYSNDRQKQLTISPHHLLIEFKKYEHYEILREDFIAVSNELFDNYTDIRGKRLGLRYIDYIDIEVKEVSEWNNYLKNELLHSIDIIPSGYKNDVSRVFNMLEITQADMRMRLQYGMTNPDYPSPIKDRSFTLDFDAYTDTTIEKAEVPELLDKFHEIIIEWFENIITDELRKKMEIVTNGK